MSDIYRIHGDNIVECERIVKIIIGEICPLTCGVRIISPSTLVYNLNFIYGGKKFSWELHLLPGFNKSGRGRWEGDIFSALRENGSFLDETPDAIITSIDEHNNTEVILCAIEFCSALQAGNQAWQRSGRAFSVGRTGCPYIYIVDFVKYELDPQTHKRRNLRFPNPVVPYSYINFSHVTGNFIAQVYVRSEEFDRQADSRLQEFDENNFADVELAIYLVKLICRMDTSLEEEIILRKNFHVVLFLAQISSGTESFTVQQWQKLNEQGGDIVNFSLENSNFNFHKTITSLGHHGKSATFLELVDVCSVGLVSRDLPFGIIPSVQRSRFVEGLFRLYPTYDKNVLKRVASSDSDLIICIVKGFKPRGDDARPDRGILPLIAMLTSTDIDIMTYIYGPIIANNYNLLSDNPLRLASVNGFWKSVLALSKYVALDVPILGGNINDAEKLIDTTVIKFQYIDNNKGNRNLVKPFFSSIPMVYHENDVDTGIHFIFSHLLEHYCFEGMCNPPGGDWSGLSVIVDNNEVRWTSLPRVSAEVNGKRPDHVLEIFNVGKKPLLLVIESKEKSQDLELNVGIGLINYIRNLMAFVPNVKRKLNPQENWKWADSIVSSDIFEFVSVAAYLRSVAQPQGEVFSKSKCDLLIVMEPVKNGWFVELIPQTESARVVKEFIVETISNCNCQEITIY